MGKVGSTLFGSPGGSTSTSSGSSSNQAYPALSGALTPALAYTGVGGSAIANLLGLGGNGSTAGLQNYADAGGMQFQEDNANRQITSSQSANGLLNSGSTLKKIATAGQGLGNQYLTSMLSNLSGLSNLGLGAAGVMAGAGNTSTHTSTEKNTGAKQGLLSQIASGLGGKGGGGGSAADVAGYSGGYDQGVG